MGKVLGLDIGSYSIKGAVFDVAFRSYMLTDLYESRPLKIDDLQGEERDKAQAKALRDLLLENQIYPDLTVTAIPGTLVSTRMISLPFDKKKLDKVLPFELESYLPFSLDQLLIDYHTISRSRNQTSVMAAAVKKEVVEAHLAFLKQAGIDPKIVDIDSFAILSAYHTLNIPKEETVAIIDIGHSKTILSVIGRGNLDFTRTFMTGGKNLTNALRMNLDLTYDQAEEVKIRHGILEVSEGELVKKDLKKISDVLRSIIDPLISEIRQTVYAYKAQHTPGMEAKPISKLFICGGTSLLKNIDMYISEKTGIQCQPLHCFPPDHEISRKLGRRERLMTCSISLGLKQALKNQGKRVSDINLRKDDFVYQYEFKSLKSRVSFIGIWLAILLSLVMINFGIRYYKIASKNAKIEKEVLKVFSETVRDYDGKPGSSEKAIKIMTGLISDYRKKVDLLTAGLNEMSALSILREISARMPDNVTVDIQDMNIFKNNVTLSGEIDSFSSVDRLIANLTKFPRFTKVDKGETRDSSDPNRKKFSITITIGEAKEQ